MTTQTLLLVALFVAALAMLPWLVRWLQRRTQGGMAAAGLSSRLVGALAVGPQQRVVTVEVGPPGARTWLVLGVTPQSVNLLHSMPAGAPDFAGALVKAESRGGPAVEPAP
ncbi:FliO/MopB family protein [Pseudorhodoferax sp. Leaf267]|uniref:FliO/MopB family protein n=1 Tax=Pseudorhodoferax sp. Leaf267 TaxID=1736316 RepID=UPI000A504A05